jgi:fructose-1,6-bisphosphatase/inositol monophosphatase family enzyme
MSLIDEVATVLREAAATAVLPRFRRLGADEIEEKTPGELVTIADREAETMIAAGLGRLRPGIRVIGEEACSRAPELLDGLGDGEAWIVDPIDGTANFAAGRAPFSLMVALLRDGAPVQAWLLDPLTDALCVAEQGAGAWRDGIRLGEPGPDAGPARWRGIASHFFRPSDGDAIAGRLDSAVAELGPSRRCAGAEYPLVAGGAIDFAIYWRSLPWDHAPGALIVAEAGGAVTRFDGSPYRPAVEGRGLIVARTPEMAADLSAIVREVR